MVNLFVNSLSILDGEYILKITGSIEKSMCLPYSSIKKLSLVELITKELSMTKKEITGEVIGTISLIGIIVVLLTVFGFLA